MDLSHLISDIVVTGAGVVSAIGHNKDDFEKAALNNHSYFSEFKIDREYSHNLEKRFTISPVHHLKTKNLIHPEIDRTATRIAKMSMIASEEALRDANIKKPAGKNVGVVFGSALSASEFRCKIFKCIHGKKRVSPLKAAHCVPNEPLGCICLNSGVNGYNTSISSFGSASMDALLTACMAIKAHSMDAMVVVCAEELSDVSINVLEKKGLIKSSDRLERTNKTGIVPGENAAAIVIESKESAIQNHKPVLASLGRIFTSPASSAKTPGAVKKLMTKVMQSTCKTSAQEKIIEPSLISLNLNGDSMWDRYELDAINHLFNKPGILNLKPYLGSLLGSSGLFQIIGMILFHKNKIGLGKNKVWPPMLINCFNKYGNFTSLSLY